MFSNQIYDTWFSCYSWNCCKEKYTVILFYLKVYNSKSETIGHIGGIEYCCNGIPTATDACSTQTHCWLTTADYTRYFIVITTIRITIKSLFDDVFHCYDNELEDERSIVGINWIEFSDKVLFKYHVTDMTFLLSENFVCLWQQIMHLRRWVEPCNLKF